MGFDKRAMSQAAKKKFEEMEKAKAAGDKPTKRPRLTQGVRIGVPRPAVVTVVGPSTTVNPEEAAQQALAVQPVGQASGSGAGVPPSASRAAPSSPPAAEGQPFIVDNEKAAWTRVREFITLDDVVPFSEWTNGQLTRSMNLDFVRVSVCLIPLLLQLLLPVPNMLVYAGSLQGARPHYSP